MQQIHNLEREKILTKRQRRSYAEDQNFVKRGDKSNKPRRESMKRSDWITQI